MSAAFGNGSACPGLPYGCHCERRPWTGRLLVVTAFGRVVKVAREASEPTVVARRAS